MTLNEFKYASVPAAKALMFNLTTGICHTCFRTLPASQSLLSCNEINIPNSSAVQEDKEEQFGKQALSVGQEGRKEGMKGSVDKLGPAVRGCFQTVLKDVREPLRVWRPVACKRKHALPMVYERVKTLVLYDDKE